MSLEDFQLLDKDQLIIVPSKEVFLKYTIDKGIN